MATTVYQERIKTLMDNKYQLTDAGSCSVCQESKKRKLMVFTADKAKELGFTLPPLEAGTCHSICRDCMAK